MTGGRRIRPASPRLAPGARECRHESLDRRRPATDPPADAPAGRRRAPSARSASGWIETLAADAAADPSRRKSCILLWMTGGPSQTDTFDPKPGHANGGPFKPIETAVPGILLGAHLPKLARQVKDLAIIRSMSTKEGDHGRATYNLRTGYLPQGPIRYPTLGSLVAKEFEDESAELPGFVSISPVPGVQPGRLRPGVPRPAVRPADRRRAGRLAAGDAASSSFRVERPRRPAAASAAPGPTTGSGSCDTLAQGLPREPPRRRRRSATRTPTCGPSR